MKDDDARGQAAFNLAVLKGGKDPDAGVAFCRKAVEAEPDHPRYAYTLAFYLVQAKQLDEAVTVLETLLKRHPRHNDAIRLLQSVQQER
jgi:cytochrome c-type biogenesis protein CcmH/NrfG